MFDERLIYPSHSGIVTFMRAPYKKIDELKENDIAVIGVPFDTTLGSRPGARFAPRAIREQSIHGIYHLGAIDGEVMNISTKKRVKFPPKNVLVDVGDSRVYTANVEKTTDSVAKDVSSIIEKGAFLVGLGGDHYITYPLVKGFEAGLIKKYKRPVKLGYIHLDAHLDAYDENDTWGKYYHGSFARRVAELDSFDVSNMVWVGINGNVGVEPYEFIIKNSGTIFSIDDIQSQGITNIIKQSISAIDQDVDAIYVTIDIDVVDHVYAPGTGSCTFGGITSSQLLEAASALSKCTKIKGIDIVELAPNIDLTGNTTKLVSSTISTFLEPYLY